MTQPLHGSDHAYLSTACLHALTLSPGELGSLHAECRESCKWCLARCQCTCHEDAEL